MDSSPARGGSRRAGALEGEYNSIITNKVIFSGGRRGGFRYTSACWIGGHLLGIRRETDYAVRTVLHLATLEEGASVQVRDVADQRLLPLSFVRRIVARLGAAGLLETTRGQGGGIRLARPAAEISMLDVVQAMEGEISLNPCVAEPHTCPLAEGCPAQRAWAGASALLEGHLASIRFDALAGTSPDHRVAHKGLKVLGPESSPGAAARPRRPASPRSRREPRVG